MSALDTAMSVIKKFEGCRLNAYPDPGTGGEPWTIGWGNTIYANGQKVKKGDVITKEDAESLLRFYVNQFLNSVDSVVKSEISENQLAALTSFAYNCGIGALQKSTLLKKVNLNPNDPTIRDEFMKWNKANKKIFPGLTRRRKDEADLYFTK
jgi:lysozyme